MKGLLSNMNSKPKLLYIVESFGGGVFTYLVDLANNLSVNYDIVIAYGIRKQTPENYREYFKPEIRMIQVKNFGRSVNPVHDLRAFSEIRHICEQVQPDIIHLHSSKAGVLGRFAFDGRKIPIFYTPHGYSFLMQDENRIKRTLYKCIEKVSAMRTCVTISCSKGEHEETLALTQNAVYVNNGINIAHLNHTLSKLHQVEGQKEHAVFTLGRICYQKNPELFNQIALQFPKIRFIWIGDGELRSSLTADNIEVTGWLERHKALEKAQEADMFMLTSLWEGLPISLLEAMYMKKICIVSNVIGNKDVIRNGYNGFVCQNVQDFCQAIKSVLSSDTQELTQHAYHDILNIYNTDVMSAAYNKIYQKAIKEKKI